MYDFEISTHFKKKFKKLKKKDSKLGKKIIAVLNLLAKNPKFPSLKSHKVISYKFGIKWSSRVTGDIRIIWDYNNQEINVLDILDLGGHSGRNKVYK
jgi:mRNA-degrading endonuclease YafQ of YafQ-DinJ toxin-antitoxin module